MTEPRYTTPGALRRALTDRLRTLASDSPWTVPQLQRQIAYDRLLERLYRADDAWVVKGATALLAREIGVRGTLDVDLFRARAPTEAERDLRSAAELDLGDWFRFELGRRSVIGANVPAIRLSITTYVGPAPWAQFSVDLLTTSPRMTGDPDQVPALARLSMPGVDQHGYQAYPLVDHVADKVIATLGRYGTAARPSTRFKDLVDLVAIVVAVRLDADAQRAALLVEAERRGVALPCRFDVPDRSSWSTGYAAEAARSLLMTGRSLEDALDVVKPFIDPLLDETAEGQWDPERRQWCR
jgi:hypothetical protein